jgi:hypothetical protein
MGPGLAVRSASLVPEDEPVILLKIVAALLLLVGSGLLFESLVVLDRSTRPGRAHRRPPNRPLDSAEEPGLPKAA